MKKIFSILLAILMLVSTSGFSFNVDYCNFKKKANMTVGKSKSCCCKNKKSMKDCCSNTHLVLKQIKDKFTPSSISKVAPKVLVCIGTPAFYQVPASVILASNTFAFDGNKAPPENSVPFSILYHSFLI